MWGLGPAHEAEGGVEPAGVASGTLGQGSLGLMGGLVAATGSGSAPEPREEASAIGTTASVAARASEEGAKLVQRGAGVTLSRAPRAPPKLPPPAQLPPAPASLAAEVIAAAGAGAHAEVTCGDASGTAFGSTVLARGASGGDVFGTSCCARRPSALLCAARTQQQTEASPRRRRPPQAAVQVLPQLEPALRSTLWPAFPSPMSQRPRRRGRMLHPRPASQPRRQAPAQVRLLPLAYRRSPSARGHLSPPALRSAPHSWWSICPPPWPMGRTPSRRRHEIAAAAAARPDLLPHLQKAPSHSGLG